MKIPVRLDDGLVAVATVRRIMLAVVDHGLRPDLFVALWVSAVVVFKSTLDCRMRLNIFPLAFVCAAPTVMRTFHHQTIQLRPDQSPRAEALGPRQWLPIDWAGRASWA